MLKKLLVLILLVTTYALLVTDCPAQSESITFTTYYPSPYGVYRRLRVHPSAADPGEGPASACTNPGELYFDSTTNNLYICSGSPSTWVAVGGGAGGGFWDVSPSDPNNIYNTNLGNVGIGTATPVGELDTRGDIIIDNDNAGEGGRIRMDQHYLGAPAGDFDALIIEKTDDDTTVEGGIVLGFSTSNAADTPLYAGAVVNPNWATTFTPAMTIRGSGNVGIGTTNPTGRLDIIGDEVRIWDGTATVNSATGQGDLYVEDTLEVDNQVCLGGVCRNSWPGGGGGPGTCTTRTVTGNGKLGSPVTVSCNADEVITGGGCKGNLGAQATIIFNGCYFSGNSYVCEPGTGQWASATAYARCCK